MKLQKTGALTQHSLGVPAVAWTTPRFAQAGRPSVDLDLGAAAQSAREPGRRLLVSWRERKWQWQLNRRCVNAVDSDRPRSQVRPSAANRTHSVARFSDGRRSGASPAFQARAPPGLARGRAPPAPHISERDRYFRHQISPRNTWVHISRCLRNGPFRHCRKRRRDCKWVAAHSLAPESTALDYGLASGRLSQSGPCHGQP